MAKQWLTFNFETAPSGVSTAISPDLLPTGQFAWGMNVSIRGGKPQTRPSQACRLFLPPGLVQGMGYFGAQDGMLVVMIEGRPYRIRVGARDFSYENISLPWYNSGIQKQVWMQQTVETLIIQDGQSAPILYNGSSARRASATEVPLGRQMAYGHGRLWVAVGNKRLLAGDIRTNQAYSELKFTEVGYLSGGGSLFFPRGISGLAFIPVTGTTDYGTLLVLGTDYTESIRADITSRDDWQTYPGFETNVLRNIGTASEWSITEVNQDLYWRDSLGGIRSIKSSVLDESGPGNTPISREVSRLVDYDSQSLLNYCSGIFLNNRLLMTSSPYLNTNGGVSHKNLVSLDFAPVSTMQGKSAPGYNGAWSGVHFTHLAAGKFSNVTRGFGISSDEDGFNRLWELDIRGRDDVTITCGTSAPDEVNRITAFVEYPRVDFGSPRARKRLERCDVWVSELLGELELRAYWRSDNNQKWTQWDEVEECAVTTDPEMEAPHTWKNLLPQQRPQIKTFTIPDGLDEITAFALMVGFQFQIRLEWIGRCKIERTMIRGSALDEPDYADRGALEAECLENDVTDNEIDYRVPLREGCTPPPDIPVFADLTYESRAGNITYAGFLDPRYLRVPNSVGTAGASGSFAVWSSIDQYELGNLVYKTGNFYVSLVGANVNHDPAVSPTFWQLSPAPIFWLTSSLAGNSQSCDFNATPNCSGFNFSGRTVDWDYFGSATVIHGGSLTSSYGINKFNNVSVFPPNPPCARNGSFTVDSNQGTIISDIPQYAVLVSKTSSTIIFGNGVCTQSGGNSYRSSSTLVRTFSNAEDGINDLTPNGNQTTSKAGTWGSLNVQVNCQISTVTFAVSNMIAFAQYQVEITYAADIGAAPVNDILLFSADIVGLASVPHRIPWGIVGSTVSIASYDISKV